MNRNTSGLRRGGPGRTRGVPNKATRELKKFLDGVFNEALDSTAFRQNLIDSIVDLSIDPRVLQLLLAYWAGVPPKEHKHTGGATLEQLVLGVTDEDEDDDDDDEVH